MSRKHYVRVAGILAGELALSTTDKERQRVKNMAHSLADIFKQDNSAFDRQRFMTASGF
jgi:hypothetical protein